MKILGKNSGRFGRRLMSVLAMSFVMAGSSLAAVCFDGVAVNHPPQAPEPQQTGFDHFSNRLLSSLYTAYHMAHDVIVAEGEPAVMTAKFDYDFTFHKDLEDEVVHAYIFGTGMSEWEYLGGYITDSDGKIDVDLGKRSAGEYRVYMVVGGDLSTTTGYLSVVQPGSEAVVFDIDGTLTLSDFEAVGDYLGVSTATAYPDAVKMVNAYQEKHYRIIYLTARPYWLARDTREWLALQQIPVAHLHLDSNAELFNATDKASYKADYIQQLMESGMKIVRVYGNATTDIQAYQEAGIPKSETYMIGEHAGEAGTQAIVDSYSGHVATVVKDTPEAHCHP